MRAQIMAAVAAIVLPLSVGVASAAEAGDGSSQGYLQQQQRLRNEPGYSVGTGAAHIGDGSDPNYQATQRQLRNMPGFRFGEANAQVSTRAQ
jgi:hypothetical protein